LLGQDGLHLNGHISTFAVQAIKTVDLRSLICQLDTHGLEATLVYHLRLLGECQRQLFT
jgi:hypothetical protein